MTTDITDIAVTGDIAAASKVPLQNTDASAPTPAAPWPTRFGRVNLAMREFLAAQGWVR